MKQSISLLAITLGLALVTQPALAQCPTGNCYGGAYGGAYGGGGHLYSAYQQGAGLRVHKMPVDVGAFGARQAARFAGTMPWNQAAYAHYRFGRPVSLVVPPVAQMHNTWSWGVNSSRMYPLYHQYGRSYPGQSEMVGASYPSTPMMPSHTNQFGVYPLRAPW